MNMGRIDGRGAGPPDEPPGIEREIESIRGELDLLVRELDRRRHEALDWRLQVRRHRRELSIATGVAGVAIVGLVWWRAHRQRRAHTGDIVRALRLVTAHPDALARAVEEQQPSSRIAANAAKIASIAIPALVRGFFGAR
jgi:hypothetical protein